jgi:hypothetical protein
MRECDFVFRAYLLSDDNFTNNSELVPVFVERLHISVQWFELGPRCTGDGHIQGFGGEEGVFVEQIVTF